MIGDLIDRVERAIEKVDEQAFDHMAYDEMARVAIAETCEFIAKDFEACIGSTFSGRSVAALLRAIAAPNSPPQSPQLSATPEAD